MHLIPLYGHTHTFIKTHTHTHTHTGPVELSHAWWQILIAVACLHTHIKSDKYSGATLVLAYTLNNAHIDHGGTHTHTHTHTHREKQKAHPEPSNVDSDPAIFKGHTSQDIISSSFVLRDLCLFTQRTHTHTHNGRYTHVGKHCIVTHICTHMHRVWVNVPSPWICVP